MFIKTQGRKIRISKGAVVLKMKIQFFRIVYSTLLQKYLRVLNFTF